MARSLSFSLCWRVIHAPARHAFALCLQETLHTSREPTLTPFAFSVLRFLFLCHCFPARSPFWPNLELPSLVLPGPVVLHSGAVLCSDLLQHTWSLSFTGNASRIAWHCYLSCNLYIFLSNDIMQSLRNYDASWYPLALVPRRLSVTPG